MYYKWYENQFSVNFDLKPGAAELNATAVILAHNHPYGGSKPSQEDISLTRTLTNILKVIDVRMLDHLIIGDEVTAFSELGLLQD